MGNRASKVDLQMNKARLTKTLTLILIDFQSERKKLHKQAKKAGLRLLTNESRLTQSVEQQISLQIDKEIMDDLRKIWKLM
jgi:hypothetical protein